jgi:predicted branched-subunit amino acid permease
MPATFLVLLFPRLTDRISLVVCIVAGLIAIAGALYLPGKWYMIAACLGAVLTGGLMEGAKANAK